MFKQYFCANSNQNDATEYFHIEFKPFTEPDANSHPQKGEEKTDNSDNQNGR